METTILEPVELQKIKKEKEEKEEKKINYHQDQAKSVLFAIYFQNGKKLGKEIEDQKESKTKRNRNTGGTGVEKMGGGAKGEGKCKGCHL